MSNTATMFDDRMPDEAIMVMMAMQKNVRILSPEVLARCSETLLNEVAKHGHFSRQALISLGVIQAGAEMPNNQIPAMYLEGPHAPGARGAAARFAPKFDGPK